ncbi:MAG TPA: polyphosphate kinase 1 [Pseudomonadales bacterium]|nr:polyphosphate kinase 1 [Pseudomonadales bacterium]
MKDTNPVVPAAVDADVPALAPVIDLGKQDLYINRELSQLAFNLRVLDQALDETHPLLERVRFLLIFSSNMDEFFEIRVAGLKKQIEFQREQPGPDGMRARDVLDVISRQVHAAVKLQYEIFNNILLPSLEKENIRLLFRNLWTPEQAAWARRYFREEILPVISPIGLDPAHPFPRLVNKSLNFILSLSGSDAFGRESGYAIVPTPRSMPRIIRMPSHLTDGGDNFVFLSSIIHANVEELFPGMTVRDCHKFRVTRNADLEMNAAEVEDIALALKGELSSRRFGTAVKLEVSKDCPDDMCAFLLDQFNLNESELFRLDGPLNLHRLLKLDSLLQRPDLSYPAFAPGLPAALDSDRNIFESIRREDQLLLHPFQSFTPVIDFLRSAAKDPDVVAIKQTLYRSGGKSEIVDALAEAARNGKEVTAVVELRARFDEEENLLLASRLQEAGAVVVYGVLGYKTHAKMSMIVRREGGKMKRYAHLGTGNYHSGNARAYTDYSLLTDDETLCTDVHKVFQELTGMGKTIKMQSLLHAPFTLQKQLLAMIDKEIKAAKSGKPAHIIIKVNGLTERKMIRALYRASQAGVKVDLIVRGVCCLKPRIPGVSDNIRVVSIIGRFLEHSRVYFFQNSDPQIYCSSADWMERNLLHRVEVAFPIFHQKQIKRIRAELDAYLNDNTQAWELDASGNYNRLAPRHRQPRTAQQILLDKLAN